MNEQQGIELYYYIKKMVVFGLCATVILAFAGISVISNISEFLGLPMIVPLLLLPAVPMLFGWLVIAPYIAREIKDKVKEFENEHTGQC